MSITAKILDVGVAAKELGLSRQRVFQFITAGVLPAAKLGNMYVIERESFEAFRTEYLSGRVTGVGA